MIGKQSIPIAVPNRATAIFNDSLSILDNIKVISISSISSAFSTTFLKALMFLSKSFLYFKATQIKRETASSLVTISSFETSKVSATIEIILSITSVGQMMFSPIKIFLIVAIFLKPCPK